MGYKNATQVLPTHLLEEVQRYIEGEIIYIPKNGKRCRWGQLSGARKSLNLRNNEICKLFDEGYSVDELAEVFYLSEDSIKKIVYGNK